MYRYNTIKEIGNGTYGIVSKAINRETNEVVAIKKMKICFPNWNSCTVLREIQSLRRLSHPHIVQLKEVLREEDNSLNLVFEYLEANLYDVMRHQTSYFPDFKIRHIMRQVLNGVQFMHTEGLFHRDLKPENILVKGEICKIADFGLAREIASRPPYTEYVSTRWYRAPEIILRSRVYNSPIDMFACGCIMAELFTLRPLFPGDSEVDQIHKIFSVLGKPGDANWNNGYRVPPTEILRKSVPNASKGAIVCIEGMLKLDPLKRFRAKQVLNCTYFEGDKFATPKRRKMEEGEKTVHVESGQSKGDKYFEELNRQKILHTDEPIELKVTEITSEYDLENLTGVEKMMNAETSKEHETFANISSTTNAFFFKQSNGYMPYLDSKGKSQNILTTTPLTHNSTLLQKPNKTDHLALNEGLPQQNAIQNILSPRFNRQGFNEDRPDKFEYPTLPSNIVTLFHSL